MKRMDLGKGWLIIEYFRHESRRTLVSIINSRRTGGYVKEYLEQTYIDRHASFEDKIAYKKNPKSWSYRVLTQMGYEGLLECGDDPVLLAFYCHKLVREDGLLTYTFKNFKGETDMKPLFGEVTQSINIKEKGSGPL